MTYYYKSHGRALGTIQNLHFEIILQSVAHTSLSIVSLFEKLYSKPITDSNSSMESIFSEKINFTMF